MANRRITELTNQGTFDGSLYVEVDDAAFPETKKMTLDILIGEEETAREDQDDVIEAGAGLETDGTYDPDDTTNYIRTADFVAEGITASLKNADFLLDKKLAEVEADALGAGTVTKTTVTVATPSPNGLHSVPYNLLGHPIADTDFTGYRIKVIDAWARIDYSTAAIEVGTDVLVLRYSDGTQIGTWTNGFYESAADAVQSCKLDDNINIPTGGDSSCIQLYCASDSGGGSNSDFYISLIYVLEVL